MQHPDEGTIHSWLDNALSAEETARVASHVAECPQCAAAVAEARGFIAASSRILTALDDVPRGVVPAVPVTAARKRDFRVLWRAAAAVLVVAGGSFVVMRDGGQEERGSSSIADRALVDTSTSNVAADAGGTVSMATEAVPQQAPAPMSKRRAAPPPVRSDKVAPPIELEQNVSPPIVLRGRASGIAGGAVAQSAGTNAATVPSVAKRVAANTVTSESEVPPLKVLRVERAIGGRRIIYEIAPTDTVTLTETELSSLSAVVTTGVATVQGLQERTGRTRAVAPTRPEAAAATTAAPPPPAPLTDSRRAADTVVAKEGAVMMQAAGAAAQRDVAASAPRVNSIRWTETGTGKTLVLSGKISVARLEEIKRRIETERATADKKTP